MDDLKTLFAAIGAKFDQLFGAISPRLVALETRLASLEKLMGSLTRTVSPRVTAFSAGAPSQTSVPLTWSAPQDVQGSYTQTLTRFPAFAVPVMPTGTSYNDSAVSAGQSYSYTLTVTDSRGLTSAPLSTQATVPNTGGNLQADLDFEGTALGAPTSGNPPTLSTVRAREGSKSAEIFVHRQNSITPFRTEMVPLTDCRFNQNGNQDTWFGGSFYLPTDYIASPNGEIIWQAHGSDYENQQGNPNNPEWWEGTLNPPISLHTTNDRFLIWIIGDARQVILPPGQSGPSYQRNTRYYVGPNGLCTTNEAQAQPIGAKGRWFDFVAHIRWGFNAAMNPLLEVWLNDVKILTDTGLNCFNDSQGPYLKCGMYKFDWKDPVTPADTVNYRRLWWDAIRASRDGTGSYGLVAPRGARPNN